MAGNWKMYKTPADTRHFFEKFRPLVENTDASRDRDLPALYDLPRPSRRAGTRIGIGAQNLAG